MTTRPINSIFTSTHAIIFGVCADTHLIEKGLPLCQLPLGPKLIIQHTVESAVRLGARTVDVVISEGAHEIREFLGDGQRFGIKLRIRLVAESEHPYTVFKFLCRDANEDQVSRRILLHTSQLVMLQNVHASDSSDSNKSILLNDLNGKWTGVAEVSSDKLRALATSELTYEALASALSEADASFLPVANVLRLDSPVAILESQGRVLNDEFPELVENYRSAEPGVWIGRNSRIHPTAQVISPVFISENCDIEAGTVIGPGVWLGERTLVGPGAVLSNSIVLSMSSIGEELTIKDSIVSRSHVLNTRIGVSLSIVDDLVLGDLSHNTLTQFTRRLVSRLTGLVLFLTTVPVLGAYWLLASFRHRTRLVTRKYVKTPAPSADFLWRTIKLAALTVDIDPDSAVSPRTLMWRDLCTRIIPSLSQVVMGNIQLCGMTLRTPAEVAELPEYWKAIILSSPCGLISESLAQCGPHASNENRWSGDVWFAMSSRRFETQRLFASYVRSLTLGPPGRNINEPIEHLRRETRDTPPGPHSMAASFMETEHA